MWFYWLSLFVIQTVVELLFVAYLYAISERRPVRAASLGVASYMLHAICVVSFVSSGWSLIPIGAGVFVGSWIVVRQKSNTA